jgi:hypothetical protein
MKKLVFILTGLFIFSMINAQSLEEIVKKYTAANKLDQISKFKTIKLTANMSMMGMEMPMVMWMKNPNKIRTVTNFNGQDMIQVFDGVKGSVINPMTGSSTPVAMTAEQIKESVKSNLFQNTVANYLKEGQLSLEGEDKVNNKPAYKLKAMLSGGVASYLYLDKGSYLLVKLTSSNMEAIPSEYTETNGIFLPMKNTVSASGMEFVMTFTKVEVDIPMDDSLFIIK